MGKYNEVDFMREIKILNRYSSGWQQFKKQLGDGQLEASTLERCEDAPVSCSQLWHFSDNVHSFRTSDRLQELTLLPRPSHLQ